MTVTETNEPETSPYQEPLSESYRKTRLALIGGTLLGVAVVVVILSVVAAIWFAVDRDRQKEIRLDQQRQQTAQACIAAGNVWAANESCVPRSP